MSLTGGQGVVSGGGGGDPRPNIIIQNEQASNVAAGGVVSGAWNDAVLNTVVRDADAVVSLSSNQITGLAAGDYYARLTGSIVEANQAQYRFYNVTDSAELVKAQSVHAGTSNLQSAVTSGVGTFTLAAGKTLEVQYYVQTNRATYGQGYQSFFDANVYTILEIWKVPV